jgi:hypothetical protein
VVVAVLSDGGVAAGSMMTVRVVFDPVGDSAESGEAGLVGDDVGDGVGCWSAFAAVNHSKALMARSC